MRITNNYIKTVLRKLFLYSDIRRNVIQRCKIKRGLYFCECCGVNIKAKEIQVHHIDGCEFDGDWNKLISNIFCNEDKLRALCKPCHKKIHNK